MRTTLAALVLLIAGQASAATYYVSPTGTGAAPCVVGDPCALATAKTAVRAVVTTQSEDITVRLRAGTYTIAAPLAFTSADSGTGGFRVTWDGYPGESARISGGVVVTGWEAHSGGIFKAQLATGLTFRSIWVNGTHGERAKSAMVRSSPWEAGDTGYTAPNESYASFGNQTRIEISAPTYWSQFRGLVSTIVGTAVTMRVDYWAIYRAKQSAWGLQMWWIENALELLDATNEWYYNDVDGWLYYQPAGGSMAGLTVVYPNSEGIVTLNGASHLSFVNLMFEHAAWPWPDLDIGYPGEGNSYMTGADYTAPHVEVLPPAGVMVTDSHDIVFARVGFERMGTPNTIEILGTSEDVTVTGCTFRQNAGGGVIIGDMQYCSTPVASTTVTNNYFDDASQFDYQGAMFIALTCGEDTTIDNNWIVHSERGGNPVFIDGSGPNAAFFPAHARRTLVRNNRIIYTATDYFGSGTTWYGDHGAISTIQVQADGTYVDGTVLSGNYIYASGGAYCFYFDSFAQWVTSTNNVCQGSYGSAWLRMNPESLDMVSTGNYTDNVTAIDQSTSGATVTGTVEISTDLVVESRATAPGRILCASGPAFGATAGPDGHEFAHSEPDCAATAPAASWGGWR
jgi:hypothetical protein